MRGMLAASPARGPRPRRVRVGCAVAYDQDGGWPGLPCVDVDGRGRREGMEGRMRGSQPRGGPIPAAALPTRRGPFACVRLARCVCPRAAVVVSLCFDADAPPRVSSPRLWELLNVVVIGVG